ncbi:hypothetical protein CEG14_05630 [Bordetella genomosp. 1]|uniref:DUF1376 domain-containing protein n=1 Tax=Bordetella genomosp. 1 TaxID=1395607 RepID=A0A261SNS6_9BORD|nr:YdaU family protein [Bordetella genomosp. 1]OZI39016.1 hypothetical protein CEG14_05630 [Bordetella genomosp. 1]
MNYYPHHIGDFRSGTVNMSRQARWIYRDLMDVYYDTEKPLPDDLDLLCDMVGVESDDERRIVERLLRFKFSKTDEGYRHERCDAEIAAYHQKAAQARKNGKAGGRPRKQPASDQKPSRFPAGSDPDAIGSQEQTGSKANQEPRTNNQETEELPPTPRKRGAGFDASSIDLPDWLDREDWQAWIADRKARKKPVTEEAPSGSCISSRPTAAKGTNLPT